MDVEVEVEIRMNAKVFAEIPWGPTHMRRGPQVHTYTRSVPEPDGHKVRGRYFMLPESAVAHIVNGAYTYKARDRHVTVRDGQVVTLTSAEAEAIIRADPPDYGPEWKCDPSLSVASPERTTP